VFYFSEKRVLKGLAIGVASMKVGERALLHVSYKLAYGKEGSFSFPNVPPMADVMFEVELVGFEEPREVRVSTGSSLPFLMVFKSNVSMAFMKSITSLIISS
jgi:hypothetical protein